MSGARTGVVVAVLAVLPLAGCGGGNDYCGTVGEHQSQLGSIARSGDRTALIQALPIFEDLQSTAPDDVADDWQLLVTRIQALDTALKNADVDPATYDAKHPPAGLSAGNRSLIRRAAAQLAASDTQQALTTVQQEVLDVCHEPLEL
ncbi:MAG TPA: hypothetical protein VGK78_04575 [Nocardioides sp.]|uniref:hypothetical protein n=1 Tax=Nocardioides sp. TaxID=35761 RepID=UPI002F42A118